MPEPDRAGGTETSTGAPICFDASLHATSPGVPNKRAELIGKLVLLSIAVGLIVYVSFAVSEGVERNPWDVLAPAVLKGFVLAGGWLVFLILSTLVHEVFHAAAARLLGYWIYAVSFWAPLPLTHFKVFGTWTACAHALQGGGCCEAYPRVLPESRLAPFFFYAAGPLSHLFIGALLVMARLVYSWDPLVNLLLLWGIIAGALTFLFNAWPQRVQLMGMQTNNDGANIWELTRVESARVQLRAAHAAGILKLGEPLKAVDLCVQALKDYPGNRRLRILHSAALVAAGQFAQAKSVLEEILGEARSDQFSTYAKNNLAWLLSEVDAYRDVPRADALSNETILESPNHAYFIGTRGIVLHRMGRRDEAHTFLRSAYSKQMDPVARGYVAAILGIHAVENGDRKQAANFLRRAEYLAPSGALCASLRKMLESDAPNSSSTASGGDRGHA